MKVSLDEVVEYLDGTHNYGSYYMACCPYHDDHSPSCSVSQKGFICLSCGERGSLEKIYSFVSGRIIKSTRSFNPAGLIWRKWAERFGSIEQIAKLAHSELTRCQDLGIYLEQRKVDSQIKFGMFGFLDGYYTFPIKNEYGEIRGLVVRASPTIQSKENRYSVSPDCELKLYVPSWRKVNNDDYLYVPFGTLDSWSLFISGYASVTGISGQELNFHNLDRFRKPMFIIPDKGEEKKAVELQARLGWRGMPLYLDWPDGIKDINGIHQKYGIEKIVELVEKSKRRYNL